MFKILVAVCLGLSWVATSNVACAEDPIRAIANADIDGDGDQDAIMDGPEFFDGSREWDVDGDGDGDIFHPELPDEIDGNETVVVADLDGNGEEEVIIMDDDIMVGDGTSIDIDGDGEADVIVIGMGGMV